MIGLWYNFQKAYDFWKTNGTFALIVGVARYIAYQVVRPRSPRVRSRRNRVLARQARLVDLLLPRHQFHDSHYEEALCDAVTKYVSEGDRVLELGAGVGVVTVYASRAAGNSGNVVSYEASPEMLAIAEETIENNWTAAQVNFHHAIVGEPKQIWGNPDQLTEHMALSDLPSADVYVIDIEGSEVSIVSELQSPHTVMVESHGYLDSPTNCVKESLRNNGYEIVSIRLAEPNKPQMCKEKDIRVVVGTRKDDYKTLTTRSGR